MSDPASSTSNPLARAKEEFITQWGVMGSTWGINRTMAQIHALLLVSEAPLCTDQVMETLKISRGNAHSNLRELVSWGIVKSVARLGERKEFFEAEQDVWKMFCIISRERKRRELDPAVEVLHHCADSAAGMEGESARRFQQKMRDLCEFTEIFGGMLDRFAAAERSKAVPLAMKMLK